MLEHNERLYSGSADHSIQVWDIHDVKWVARLVGHQRPIVELTVTASNRLLSLAGRTVRIWDISSLKCMQVVYLAHSPQAPMVGQCSYTGGSCRTMTISADNGCAYVGTQDSNISLYDSVGWSVAASQEADARDVDCPSGAKRDGQNQQELPAELHAAALLSTSDAAYEEVANGRVKAHLAAINDIVIFDRYLCSCGGDAMIRVMDPATLEPKGTLRGHRGSVLCLAAAGDLLLSGGRDNTIRVWDMDTFCCRRTLQGHKHDILKISTLAVCPPSEEPPHRIRKTATSFQVSKVPFLFASTSADGTARLWCGVEWVCLHVFTLTNVATGGALSHSDSLENLATGSLLARNRFACITCAPGISINEAAQLITRQARQCTNKLNSHRKQVQSDDALKGLVLNSSSLAVGSLAGTIYIYDISSFYAQSVEKNFGEASEGSSPGSCTTSHVAEGEGDAAVGEITSPRFKKRKFMVQSNIDAELLDRLRAFIAIPSVSGIPLYKDDCFRAAKYIAKQLEVLGAEVKMSQTMEGKNPVVIGRLGRNPDVPTVTFYGHYDVQPAGHEGGWRTNPFEMASIDGYLYGRGTSDNKGPILGFVFAVRELLESCSRGGRELPVNCAFCFEGEEENGSHGFAATLEANQHWFTGTQAIVVSNTLWIGENRPCLTYGMRGLICLDVAVTGPERDLHSGNDGGVFNEPMLDLVNVISTLVDGRNSILVPGFQDGIEEHGNDRKILEAIEKSGEFELAAYRARLGVPSLTEARSISDLLYQRWCAPSLSIVDIRSGDTADDTTNSAGYRFGPTRFSVVPHKAVGKVSIRFVAKQRPEHLVSSMKNHLQHEFAKLRTLNKLMIMQRNVGDWWEADPNSHVFKVAERAVEREWGQMPLHVREGGTMPMVATLEKTLGAPAIMLPFGQSSDNPHLANERIRGVNLVRGKNVVLHLLQELGIRPS